MEAMNWGETQGIVHALIRVFDDARDSEAALRVREVFDELGQLFKERERDMKEVIKSLQGKVDVAKAKAERPEPSEAFVARMAELEEQRKALTENIESLKGERDVTKAKLAAIKEEALQLAEKLAEVDAEASEDIPRIRYAISLYANVTNIRWDFEREDVLAGYIAPPNGMPKPFEIGHMSDFEVASRLWELMG
mmetsp:Transcript_75608/g.182731  ORF Transcript_75608/g.182731 Transcript_75608/m.182731 type:complete len:194 (+) Transcript_75608:192-773(+)